MFWRYFYSVRIRFSSFVVVSGSRSNFQIHFWMKTSKNGKKCDFEPSISQQSTKRPPIFFARPLKRSGKGPQWKYFESISSKIDESHFRIQHLDPDLDAIFAKLGQVDCRINLLVFNKFNQLCQTLVDFGFQFNVDVGFVQQK